MAPLWPETVTASRCPLSAAGVCPLEISHGRGGKAKDSSELFPESSGCKTGDSVRLQTPCHPSLISALSCIQHQVTGRAYMSTGAPQGGVWQCGREREHVPVTEGHVPLHLDGSGAREPRADTSLPDHSKHPNDAHPDICKLSKIKCHRIDSAHPWGCISFLSLPSILITFVITLIF